MKRLPHNWKRGRPDIVHFALMEALSTPLFLRGMLRVYIHTINDKVISIADNLRIPKSYFRFERLMANLFKDKIVKSSGDRENQEGKGEEDGIVLLELKDNTFAELIKDIYADKVIGLSTVGVKSSAQKVVEIAKGNNHCAFVIGAFPKGHFSENVTKYLGPTYSISDLGLEAHVVIARVLYECEKILVQL